MKNQNKLEKNKSPKNEWRKIFCPKCAVDVHSQPVRTRNKKVFRQ